MEASRFYKIKKPLLETKPNHRAIICIALESLCCCASERPTYMEYSGLLGLQKYSNSVNTFSKHKDPRVK